MLVVAVIFSRPKLFGNLEQGYALMPQMSGNFGPSALAIADFQACTLALTGVARRDAVHQNTQAGHFQTQFVFTSELSLISLWNFTIDNPA